MRRERAVIAAGLAQRLIKAVELAKALERREVERKKQKRVAAFQLGQQEHLHRTDRERAAVNGGVDNG